MVSYYIISNSAIYSILFYSILSISLPSSSVGWAAIPIRKNPEITSYCYRYYDCYYYRYYDCYCYRYRYCYRYLYKG